jgi:hypothetical protein
VDCFERITALETEVADLRAEKAEAAKQRFEWKKTLITILLSFLLSGGGLLALVKGLSK